jgi:1,4-alpha-glucan branching enzyme
VFVAGDFNEWQSNQAALQKGQDGRWTVELPLPPGRHEYRFFVDGQWTDDPVATEKVANPFGGFNAVRRVA